MPRISVHSRMILDTTIRNLERDGLVQIMTADELACYNGAKRLITDVGSKMNIELPTNRYIKIQNSFNKFQDILNRLRPSLEKRIHGK